MKFQRVAGWVVLLLLLPVWALAEQSRITEVSVYADRAQVTRTANVSVPGGEVELVFGGLPASLDNNSVQVWGTGSAKASLEGVIVEVEPPPEVPEGKVAELEKRLQELEDQRKTLKNKKKAIASRISMLTSVKPEPPRPDDKSWGNAAEISRIIDSIIKNLRAAYAEQRAIEADLREIKRKINVLRAELRKIQNPSGTRTKKVTVNLTVARAGKMKIMFSYIIPNATWRPLYDIRALPDDGKVEIAGYAEIIQRTGEDWEDVSLSVSTAKPQIGGTPPEVEPIYLVFYSPPPPRPTAAPPPPPRMAGPTEAAPEPEEALEDMIVYEEVEMEAEVVTAQVRAAGTAVLFEVKQRKTIPSDGEPHRVPILSDSMDAEFGHASWPEAVPFAFLRAKIINNTGHPFVAGDAKVFLESSYVGTTVIDNWAQTEEKTISLGIDQGIRIERKLMKKDEKETGSKRTFSYEFKIEINNFKKKAVKLELYDRVPISRQGDIDVKVARIEPEPVEHKDDGILKWMLNLNAGEKTEIRFSYTVRFPKDRTVVGLP